MKHKTKVGIRSLKKLAEDIGNLRYDALAEFFRHLKNKLLNDSEADLSRGRKKLARHLFDASMNMFMTEIEIRDCWVKYCKDK
jgi:ADP-heptose:LPS heptosyltransferase